jgi:hypothetical protein
MRFPWLLSIGVAVGSCLVSHDGDRLGRLMPSPQASNAPAAVRFVPEANLPPLLTQGAGTR